MMSQDQSSSSLIEVNTPPDQIISQIIQTSSSKNNSTKASFDDLEKSKSSIKSQSSTIILSSPLASTPEEDIVELNTFLDKIDSFDNMNVGMFIRNIFKKINRESNQYLRGRERQREIDHRRSIGGNARNQRRGRLEKLQFLDYPN